MNHQLKEPLNFDLRKNVSFKDKKIVKYRKYRCLFPLNFIGYKSFHKADFSLELMKRKSYYEN